MQVKAGKNLKVQSFTIDNVTYLVSRENDGIFKEVSHEVKKQHLLSVIYPPTTKISSEDSEKMAASLMGMFPEDMKSAKGGDAVKKEKKKKETKTHKETDEEKDVKKKEEEAKKEAKKKEEDAKKEAKKRKRRPKKRRKRRKRRPKKRPKRRRWRKRQRGREKNSWLRLRQI